MAPGQQRHQRRRRWPRAVHGAGIHIVAGVGLRLARQVEDWVLVSSLDGQQLVNTGMASVLPLPRRSAAGLAVQARANLTNRIIATLETAQASAAELPWWFMTTTENPDRVNGMTRTEAIATITATLEALPDTQVAVLAEIAASLAMPTAAEDDATRAAIAEGLAEADRGEMADPAAVDALLNKPWR